VLAPYLLFIPLMMLFESGVQVTQQWLIRKQYFKVTAKMGIFQAIIVNMTKSGVGLYYPIAASLIFITSLGSALYSIMLATGAKVSSN
ncbi:lipopolysaccharide biosynthesis protein, partial [Planococcus sp. SIMBA_143]